LIAGVLDIRHVLNTDTAFSVLGDVIPLTQRLLLLRLTAWLGVFVVGLFIIGRWKRASSVERLGWALVLGGALGNALDRLIRGSVVDFIYVHYWPVFNVADIAITSGVALMILVTRRRAAVGRNA
jgi:signal peptidase II